MDRPTSTDEPLRIGALVPLSRPGWVEAGRHLLAGLELGVREANLSGRPLELIVRDTAADPAKAVAAVDELTDLGVAALAGEYHSVVARAVATRADALGVPFLCSSAVLDNLTDHPTDWVARIAPPQSRGWKLYADFLLNTGHTQIAIAAQPSIYWSAGTAILRNHLTPRGATITELHNLTAPCDELVAHGATALLLLTGFPDPAVPIVQSIRRDPRLTNLLIGAPAGQPEFSEWSTLLGKAGTAIPFLRYLPAHLTPLGLRVESALHNHLGEPPSFVAYEGYDTIAVLASVLRTHPDRTRIAESWTQLAIEGTRGPLHFSRTPTVWQYPTPPIQITDRNPTTLNTFRVLHTT